jgi:hypothetical protein
MKDTPRSVSRRKPKPILFLQGKVENKIKMDPGLRRDDAD